MFFLLLSFANPHHLPFSSQEWNGNFHIFFATRHHGTLRFLSLETLGLAFFLGYLIVGSQEQSLFCHPLRTVDFNTLQHLIARDEEKASPFFFPTDQETTLK